MWFLKEHLNMIPSQESEQVNETLEVEQTLDVYELYDESRDRNGKY